MTVVALAGGVGAGKFLRGLVRVMAAEEVTVVVNTGDDIVLNGMNISPDVDSVTYWLAGVADRERGWGRAEETFRAAAELRERFETRDSWFNLGDLDLALHLSRTAELAEGSTLSEVTRRVSERFGIGSRILPMSDDRVTTRIDAVGEQGEALDLHFQEYWVLRGARDEIKNVRFEGAGLARPGPGVIEALEEAETIVICPSNPVASIGPVLAVPGIREALAARRDRVVGISPIVGGAPLRGMADKLMPVVGLEVSALGAARAYEGLLGSWVIDDRDRELSKSIEEFGIRVGVTDTIMDDDAKAEGLARFALEMVP
ncbi:MAG: 2-phospho-L-lactate transferase [Actinomycetota bacterium]